MSFAQKLFQNRWKTHSIYILTFLSLIFPDVAIYLSGPHLSQRPLWLKYNTQHNSNVEKENISLSVNSSISPIL